MILGLENIKQCAIPFHKVFRDACEMRPDMKSTVEEDINMLARIASEIGYCHGFQIKAGWQVYNDRVPALNWRAMFVVDIS